MIGGNMVASLQVKRKIKNELGEVGLILPAEMPTIKASTKVN